MNASPFGLTGNTSRLLRNTVLCSLLWILLTQGNPHAWVIGAVAVPLATWCATYLFSPSSMSPFTVPRIRVVAVARFLGFFLAQSVKSGVECAVLALHPKASARPAFFHYLLTLPPGPARVLLVNIISLLPGTSCADLREHAVLVHVLDQDADNVSAILACEQQVARLFDVQEGAAEHVQGRSS